MISWLRKYRFKEYERRLKKAFPKHLEDDLKTVFSIIPFELNSIKFRDGSVHEIKNLINESKIKVKLGNEELEIPYRLHFNEPSKIQENKLTNRQKVILNCIYLRHHDGYLRERRLKELKNVQESFSAPFTFQLLGEYVFEILEELYNQLNDTRLEQYKRIALENPKYWEQTENRMISYWNAYYRGEFPYLKNYVGKIVFNQIRFKEIGKRQDEIIELGIDSNERLFIKPKNEHFTMIYRTATEVHWDQSNLYLYSPRPRNWTYLDWFNHIINVTNNECNCKLVLTNRTKWTNISEELQRKIKKESHNKVQNVHSR